MKDVIDKKTVEGIRQYGDAATKRFYDHLRKRELKSTRCDACGDIAFPPRDFCPSCHHRAVSWVDLPREGTIYAFTHQDRAMRFMPPDVIGLVELDGVGHILTHITGDIASLSIGQRVTLEFHEISEQLIVHRFKT